MSSEPTEVVDIDVLANRLEAHSNRMVHLEEQLEAVHDRLDEEREQRKNAEQRCAQLHEEIQELKARTDMLQLVEESDELDATQRSIALIQNLRQDALRKQRSERPAKASLTREQAERALHFPDLDRTTFYSDMRRAERLVGDKNVLWYDNDGDAELKLNLESGTLPDAIDGHAINTGE